jgi:shikimate kinase
LSRAPFNNLALIGMPAVGKSTVGILVAKRLSFRFVDTDLVIQAECGLSLHRLIAEQGCEAFRRIEEESVMSLQPESTVISTGGSIIYSDRAVAHLRKIAKVVYLRAGLEIIARRIPDPDARGLVRRPDQSLSDVYTERCPLYERAADLTVDVTDLSAEGVADLVVSSVWNEK